MYAIVRVSGFQYLVKEGDLVNVPRLELEPGSKLKLEDVLFVRTEDKAVAGKPTVAGSHVEAEVIAHPRADKVMTFKFRRRENYRRKQGHRQPLTRIRIDKIQFQA